MKLTKKRQVHIEDKLIDSEFLWVDTFTQATIFDRYLFFCRNRKPIIPLKVKRGFVNLSRLGEKNLDD